MILAGGVVVPTESQPPFEATPTDVRAPLALAALSTFELIVQVSEEPQILTVVDPQ